MHSLLVAARKGQVAAAMFLLKCRHGYRETGQTDAAPITFHDLRGTAVTRLALAECSETEIATITGHSLRDVGAILDAHYLKRDGGLAESAIKKLERRTKAPN